MMRKLMTTVLGSAVLLGLTIGMVGCTDGTETKEEVKITTPTGTTTQTQDVKVKKSGDNPPVAPLEKAKP